MLWATGPWGPLFHLRLEHFDVISVVYIYIYYTCTCIARTVYIIDNCCLLILLISINFSNKVHLKQVVTTPLSPLYMYSVFRVLLFVATQDCKKMSSYLNSNTEVKNEQAWKLLSVINRNLRVVFRRKIISI